MEGIAMYVDRNFKTKAELKRAVTAGEKFAVYNPSGMFSVPQQGEATIEGPHYPQPHRWYARVRVEQGIVVKVLG
jgi:hypothetical protein